VFEAKQEILARKKGGETMKKVVVALLIAIALLVSGVSMSTLSGSLVGTVYAAGGDGGD
jgi:hypothetical protein